MSMEENDFQSIITPSGAFNEIFLSSESQHEIILVDDIFVDQEIETIESNTHTAIEGQFIDIEDMKTNKREMENVTTTSLHQLTREGDISSIKIILDHYGQTLYKQINSLDENKVEYFDDTSLDNLSKVSALHYAARHNMLEVMKLLVESGADVDICGDDGLTPLHYAARFKISPQHEKKGRLVSTYMTDEDIKQVLAISKFLVNCSII